jgi:transcriptional regulator of arginine metabolism
VKRQRQQALLDLVQREPLGSQQDIRDRLAAAGHVATQSTISRDLEELGLVRVRDGDGHLRYADPNDVPAPRSDRHLRAVLSEFVSGVECSGNLAVVWTPPGAANAVAEVLDHSTLPGVLATVAGDNTILVVVREGSSARTVADRLRDMAGLS